LLKNSAEP